MFYKQLQNVFEEKGMRKEQAVTGKEVISYLFNRLSEYKTTDINAVRSIGHELADTGKNIEDTPVAVILLGGLSLNHDALINNIVVTTDLVQAKLLNEMFKKDFVVDTVAAVHIKKVRRS